jgi:hypothetical protein
MKLVIGKTSIMLELGFFRAVTIQIAVFWVVKRILNVFTDYVTTLLHVTDLQRFRTSVPQLYFYRYIHYILSSGLKMFGFIPYFTSCVYTVNSFLILYSYLVQSKLC